MPTPDLSAWPVWIALFGSPSLDDGGASRIQRARCAVAAQQARQHENAAVLIMGAAVANGVVESETMRQLLLADGMAPERLIAEDRTTTTREQVVLLRDLVRAQTPARVILVSDASHLPRIRMLCHYAGLPAALLDWSGAPWERGLRKRLGDVAYEAAAWAKDWLAVWRGI